MWQTVPPAYRQSSWTPARDAEEPTLHVEYQHVRALGNPKRFRDMYRSGRRREGERRYRAHLHNGSYPALVELGETLEDAPTCLLCFEAAHEDCHRAVIVEALEARLSKLDVVHLR
jgi:hypothetical protein